MPDSPTYEQLQRLVGELAARVVELDRIVAAQADEIAELKRRASMDSSTSSPSAVVGRAVVEETGEEAFLAEQVGAESGQAAGRVVLVAEPGRGCR